MTCSLQLLELDGTVPYGSIDIMPVRNCLVPIKEGAVKAPAEKRSDRKHRQIMQAATKTFVAAGYDGTSMDEIAAKASVSKQTIYKHFSDKDRLFTEIVLATTQQVDHVVGLVANTLND